MANRAIVYRIYPDKEQANLLARTFGCVRFVYNHYLEMQDDRYAAGEKYLSKTKANDHCNHVLKDEYPFLCEVDKFALTNAIFNLDNGFQRLFKHLGGHPKFKSRKASKQSYTTNITNGNIDVGLGPVDPKKVPAKDADAARSDISGWVKLPKLGKVRAKVHRLPKDGWDIKSATVTKLADGTYQASILFEYTAVPVSAAVPTEQNAIGLDYKSDGLYVDSNGGCADMPHYYRQSEQKLSREQRRLARKQPDSKNRQKQKARVAKVSRHVANQRKDFLHKTSAAIAKQYDIVCVETLDMKAIANKGFGNGKATFDNGYGMFLTMLDYKLAAKGGQLVKVDKWFPSSQVCHVCGLKNPELKDLSIRKWTCPQCGTVLDRDVNAANNIKNEGLRILASEKAAA